MTLKDPWGIKYKYPNRNCKECRLYPCFEGIDKCVSNFAAYGCVEYKEPYLTDGLGKIGC